MEPEETQQPDLPALIEELRTVNSQLTEKSKTRKAKIEALEATIAERDVANTALTAQLRKINVDVPFQSMMESLSTLPELATEQFNKQYRIELVNNKLTILNAEDGKPSGIAWNRDAIVKALTDEKHPQAKMFQTILIVSRGSGGNGPVKPVTQRVEKSPGVNPKRFGLR